MNLVSIQFIAFALLALTMYFIVPQKYRWTVLLGASLWFYYGAGRRALAALLAVSLFAFTAGILIERFRGNRKKEKLLLGTSVIMIVGWLLITKASSARGGNCFFIVMPLGISYISFSLVSYLADIYWERDAADSSFLKFLLYVLFFPKVLQGPISRHSTLASELYSGGSLSYEKICFGSQRMIYGYFKKAVLADRIAIFTGNVFSNVGGYHGSVIMASAVLAAFELYCDFSGYMDIITGFCEMLGISMDENFRHPFFSRSAAEFWRRWHITLGTWFRDYVYTPTVMSHPVKQLGRWGRKNVSKKFGNTVAKIIALAIVWFFTGLWHGTGINYIIWGGMWGGIIIFSTVFSENIEKANILLHINTHAPSWKVFQMVRTFSIFCLGVMVTRLNSITDIKTAARSILKNFDAAALLNGELFGSGINIFDFKIIIYGLLAVLCVSVIQEHHNLRKIIASCNAPVRWIIYVAGISIVIFLGIYGSEYSTAGFAYTYF